VGCRVGDERKPAVVGKVKPLVAVGCPRVRLFHPCQQMAIPRARRRPQPESAIHMHPSAGGVGELAGFGEGIEGSRVEIAGLQADDRRVLWRLLERLRKRLQPETRAVVTGNRLDRLGAKAEQPH
jgi:hypothetical protein